MGVRRWITLWPAYRQLTGSAHQRFSVFEAGVASTRDSRYVLAPQRERLRAADGR